MDDNDKYINLNNISVDFVNDNFGDELDDDFECNNEESNEESNENRDFIYQVQGFNGDKFAKIMKVGYIENEIPSILINKFDFKKNYECMILSTLFSKQDLEIYADSCRFNMIKILINYNKKKNLVPLGSLEYNFNFFDHKKNGNKIDEYISDNTGNFIKLRGFYSITFHYENKFINLETFKEYLGEIKVLDKLIYHLSSDHIISKLVELEKDVN